MRGGHGPGLLHEPSELRKRNARGRETQRAPSAGAPAQEYVNAAAAAGRTHISGAELCGLLLNPERNELFDAQHDRVCAPDMEQPLCHYLINSSHNTYLEGDQLGSAATAAIYRRVLR